MPPNTALQAGKLRHRVEIVTPDAQQDSAGGWVIDQTSLFLTVWASVEALSGRELYAAQQQVSEVTHKIVIRWRTGILSSMCVLFEDRFFQIMAILNPDGRHKLLILLCKERDLSALEGGGTA